MLCRVEMPTNEQIFGRFCRWRILHKGGLSSKFMMIGLPVLIAAASLYFWYIDGALPIFMLALLVITLGFTIYTLYIKPGMDFRKRGGAALQTEIYIFTENGFQRSVRSEEGGPPENTSMQYAALVQAVETKDDFYLFHSPNQAYLIQKDYFDPDKGSPDELRAMLRKKLDKKFIGPKS